jgi:hypothetical protein
MNLLEYPEQAGAHLLSGDCQRLEAELLHNGISASFVVRTRNLHSTPYICADRKFSLMLCSDVRQSDK